MVRLLKGGPRVDAEKETEIASMRAARRLQLTFRSPSQSTSSTREKRPPDVGIEEISCKRVSTELDVKGSETWVSSDARSERGHGRSGSSFLKASVKGLSASKEGLSSVKCSSRTGGGVRGSQRDAGLGGMDLSSTRDGVEVAGVDTGSRKEALQ